MRTLTASALLTAISLLTGHAAGAADPVYVQPPGRSGEMPFSEAVIHNGLIFLSGQLGIDPATGRLVEGGIGPETRQTLANIQGTLTRLGTPMDRVLKCTVFLADMAEWGAMNVEYVKFFDNKPARSALGTGNGIALGARVEIECIAAAPDDA
jgi:2-iminobutanoate/2-iminopropanoate deaminase